MQAKLRSNTALYGFAQVIERLISFFLLPLLTKSISIEEYGIWSQLTLVVGTVTPILLMGFQTALVCFLPQLQHAIHIRNSLILVISVVITCVILILSSGFIFFQQELGVAFFGSSTHAFFVILLVGFILAEVFFELLIAILRSDGKIRKIALYSLLKGAIRIGVFLFSFLGLDSNFEMAIVTFIVVQLIFVTIIIYLEIPVRKILAASLKISKPYWRKVLYFALPMVPLALLTGINNSADRFLVTNMLGVDEVAVYAANYSLANIAGFFYSVLGFTLFPAISASWANGERDSVAKLFGVSLQVYCFFLFPYVIALSICGADFLVMITTESYHVSEWLLFFLVSSVGLFGIYQVSSYILILGGRSGTGILLMTLVAIFNIGLNIFFIPLWGILGAALSIFLANTALALFAARIVIKILPLNSMLLGLRGIAIRAFFMGLLLIVMKNWFLFDTFAVMFLSLFIAGAIYLIMDYRSANSILRMILQRN